MKSPVGVGGPLCYALAAARIGWWVFPLLPGKKEPDGLLAPHGYKNASRDEERLRGWWATRREHGIGLACGPSGLVVLDVDPRHGGDVDLRALLGQHREWPRTPAACTGGGGWHFFFRTPVDPVTGEVLPLRAKLTPGIDIQGDGRYVVIAPTLHPSGARYHWGRNALPSETPLADLPAWALALARRPERDPVEVRRVGPLPPRVGERASRYLARMAPSISGAGGHAALWAAALALVRGFDLGAEDALALLASEFNPRCKPPWSLRELRHKIEGAERDARSEPGYLLRSERRSA
jgi:hypothetical protein